MVRFLNRDPPYKPPRPLSSLPPPKLILSRGGSFLFCRLCALTGPRQQNLAIPLTISGLFLVFLALLLDFSVFLQFTSNLTAPFQLTSHNVIQVYRSLYMDNTRPPSKKAVGNAGWTLIHSIAANYPEKPSATEQHHAKAFLHSIGKLYPCKRCRLHFDKYLSTTPPDLSSRDQFMLWTCSAHNAVNRRSGKEEFPCRMRNLEHRWGECPCKLKQKQKQKQKQK